jgi:hypothetical protein
MLAAVAERGIEPDVVLGTSIGAVDGALTRPRRSRTDSSVAGRAGTRRGRGPAARCGASARSRGPEPVAASTRAGIAPTSPSAAFPQTRRARKVGGRWTRPSPLHKLRLRTGPVVIALPRDDGTSTSWFSCASATDPGRGHPIERAEANTELARKIVRSQVVDEDDLRRALRPLLPLIPVARGAVPDVSRPAFPYRSTSRLIEAADQLRAESATFLLVAFAFRAG